jgi:tryptophan synthase alpha chain
MNRIDVCFSSLKLRSKKALIPYITAGDPSPQITLALMHAMVDAGADIVELGVPFSDPMADGPVIQRAAERALAGGIGMPQVLEMVRQFRRTNVLTPVVLMGYANPIERYNQRLGSGTFARDAAHAGVDGVLVVDYPPEECVAFADELGQHNLAPIFLLAPTSTDRRIQDMARIARGYVYYVSLKGVTGAGHLDIDAVARMIPRIKAHVSLPVGVGFGIRDAATARAVAAVSDAVVIGSRIIQIIEDEPPSHVIPVVSAFIADIRTALDSLKGQPS